MRKKNRKSNFQNVINIPSFIKILKETHYTMKQANFHPNGIIDLYNIFYFDRALHIWKDMTPSFR